jgi:hypothetical protein
MQYQYYLKKYEANPKAWKIFNKKSQEGCKKI